MYRIALCDDEEAEIVKTQNMLSNYKNLNPELDFEINTYGNAQELLSKIQEGYLPDLILLDIYMDGKTGMEAARELREMGNQSRIIFLTTSDEHAVEAFRVEAAQYLIKPVSEADLFHLLDKQIKILNKEKQKYVILQTDKKVFRVTVHDIVYCESQGKRQFLHLLDGSLLCVRMTMSVLDEIFKPYEEIIRVGKWYIINMDHVEGLDCMAVRMDNGSTLFLPRKAYQTLREQYITYYTGVML